MRQYIPIKVKTLMGRNHYLFSMTNIKPFRERNLGGLGHLTYCADILLVSEAWRIPAVIDNQLLVPKRGNLRWPSVKEQTLYGWDFEYRWPGLWGKDAVRTSDVVLALIDGLLVKFYRLWPWRKPDKPVIIFRRTNHDPSFQSYPFTWMAHVPYENLFERRFLEQKVRDKCYQLHN